MRSGKDKFKPPQRQKATRKPKKTPKRKADTTLAPREAITANKADITFSDPDLSYL